MFMGEYNHTIDAKGRLIVPSKFREQLGNEFVITKGLDGCLFVYSNEEWENVQQSFREKSVASKDARKFFAIVRNGLFLMHIAIAFTFLINFWAKSGDARQEAWSYVAFLFEWFFSISLLAIGVVTLLAFAFRIIRISRTYLMFLAFFPQSIVTYNLAASNLFNLNGASRVLTNLSFAFYLTIVIGFFLIYIIRLIYHLIKYK